MQATTTFAPIIALSAKVRTPQIVCKLDTSLLLSKRFDFFRCPPRGGAGDYAVRRGG